MPDPERSPAVLSFVKRYGIEKARELCFQHTVRMLRDVESFRVFVAQSGGIAWEDAEEVTILDEIQDLYDEHTCNTCKENEHTLDHIAREFVVLPVTDFKVDEVVGKS